MRIQPVYSAAAANRASFVADGGIVLSSSNASDGSTSRSIIAYASHKSVALWEQPLGQLHSGVSELVHMGFSAEVTTLQGAFAEDQAGRRLEFLIAGSRSGELAILRPEADGRWASIGWPAESAEVHSATVTTACAIHQHSAQASYLIVTGSADGLVRVWELNAWSLTLLQTISTELRGALPLCAQLAKLDSSERPPAYLLALSLTKSFIQLWTVEATASDPSPSARPAFTLALQLSGHEDWVRALAFARVSESELILASGGQDNYVRLWRIARHSNASEGVTAAANATRQADDDYIEKLMRKIELGDENQDDQAATQSGSEQQPSLLSANSRAFSIGTGAERRFWVVTMDALLVGHDGWITSLRWHPTVPVEDAPLFQPAALLSTSADNSAIIWTPAAASQDHLVSLSSESASSSIWAPRQRFGELGGGTSLGFYGGIWTSSVASETESSNAGRWGPRTAITGHMGPCKSLSWDPTGCMLLSCGSDRTTRLHARFRQRSTSASEAAHTWHELARPQTHGYDLNGVAWIDQWSFASAADEKVVRVFTAPVAFVQTIQAAGGLDGAGTGATLPESAPIGASVPPLGLSNRAIFDESGPVTYEPNESGQPIGSAKTSISDVFKSPPNEDELHVSTLWPELDKLYGHGYELFAIGASHPVSSGTDKTHGKGRFVASSCKANNAEHAVIRIHDRDRHWKEVAQLAGHKLSITRIRFHPGGAGREPNRFVLSAGRDRSWHLHECIEADGAAGGPAWRAFASQQAHARIVWDCAWSRDGNLFATASRDKTVKIWALPSADGAEGTGVDLVSTLKLDSACTSVAFGPRNILAIGTERGSIELFQPNDEQSPTAWTATGELPQAHSEAVQEVAFRPGHEQDDGLHLASTSDDGCVRIFAITP
ncbi:Elongator subunit elp2 [Tilletia horrida]|nr:Elongator subunit elp2 [Tilletia horrida]